MLKLLRFLATSIVNCYTRMIPIEAHDCELIDEELDGKVDKTYSYTFRRRRWPYKDQTQCNTPSLSLYTQHIGGKVEIRGTQEKVYSAGHFCTSQVSEKRSCRGTRAATATS